MNITDQSSVLLIWIDFNKSHTHIPKILKEKQLHDQTIGTR
jgi:hypothetical protein